MAATARKVFDEMGCAGSPDRHEHARLQPHAALVRQGGGSTLAQALMMRVDADGMPLGRFSFDIVHGLR
jgi:hypothetical protein